jgi:hypothetical protein
MFLLIIVSCQRGKQFNNLVENVYSSNFSVEVNTDDVSIPIDSLSLFYYQKHFVLEDNSDWILYGYNNITHSIDVFSIAERKLLRHVNLESQGPNEILRVYGLYILSSNRIYILDRYSLKCLDEYGNVVEKYSLNFNGLPGNIDGYFIQLNEARFEITGGGKYFTGYFIDSQIRGKRRKKYLTHPIIGSIDVISKEVNFLPIYYSDFIINNEGDFSAEISPNITYLEDKIIIGFPVESNFYVFDRDSETIKDFGGASKFSSNLAKKYSINKNYDFRNEGTWFNSIRYNSSLNYYFRTHWGSQPKVDSNGRLTNGLTKPGFIMFFDNDFHIIDEIKLRDDLWLEDSFVTSGGIYFWPKIDENYPVDSLVLGRYDVVLIRN